MGPEVLRSPLFSHLKPLDEVAIKDMTERSVAKVMHQASNRHIANLDICNFQIRLGISKDQHLLFCKVCDADAVFKSAMAARGKDLIAKAELLQVLQALESRSVNYLPTILRISE